MLNRSQQIVVALAGFTYVNLSFIVSPAEGKDLQPHAGFAQSSYWKNIPGKPPKPFMLLCNLNTDVNSDFPFEVIFSIHYPQPQKNGQPTNSAALDKVTLAIENDILSRNIGICVAHETGLGCRDMVCYMASRESSNSVCRKMPEGFKVSFRSRRDSNWSSWKYLKERFEY